MLGNIISSISNNFQLYALIAIGVVISGFLIVFKYRGMKIDSLESALKNAKDTIEVKAEQVRKKEVTRKVEKEIAKVVIEAEKDKVGVEKTISDLMEQSNYKKVSSGL